MDIKIWKYRHYKWMDYEVLWVARHSETLEYLVSYKCLYNNPDWIFWVRPYDMFLENVIVDGEEKPRFEFIG